MTWLADFNFFFFIFFLLLENRLEGNDISFPLQRYPPPLSLQNFTSVQSHPSRRPASLQPAIPLSLSLSLSQLKHPYSTPCSPHPSHHSTSLSGSPPRSLSLCIIRRQSIVVPVPLGIRHRSPAVPLDLSLCIVRSSFAGSPRPSRRLPFRRPGSLFGGPSRSLSLCIVRSLVAGGPRPRPCRRSASSVVRRPLPDKKIGSLSLSLFGRICC
jgi:hypothetical protein